MSPHESGKSWDIVGLLQGSKGPLPRKLGKSLKRGSPDPAQGSKSPKSGEVRGRKTPISHHPEKRVVSVRKSPFLYRAPQRKWGFSDSNRSFLGSCGVFRPRNPVFLFLGIWTPVQDRGVRKTCMFPTCCPPTIWVISLDLCGTHSILEADDFLGACCRKAMSPKKLQTLPFPQLRRQAEHGFGGYGFGKRSFEHRAR